MVDPIPPRDDRFARESFTWRRMKPWQITVLVAVIVVLLVLLIFWR